MASILTLASDNRCWTVAIWLLICDWVLLRKRSCLFNSLQRTISLILFLRYIRTIYFFENRTIYHIERQESSTWRNHIIFAIYDYHSLVGHYEFFLNFYIQHFHVWLRAIFKNWRDVVVDDYQNERYSSLRK